MDTILDAPQQSNQGQEGNRSIRDLIQNGFKVDLGSYFSEGFALWQKDIGNSILYTLVLFFIYLFSAITIVGPLFVIGPLIAGYYKGAAKIDRGESISMGDYFDGFKHFGPLLKFSLLILGLVLCIYVLMFGIMGLSAFFGSAVGPGASIAVMGLMMLLMLGIYVLGAYLMTIWWFTYPLIIFGNLGTSQAMRVSRMIVKKQFWWVLLIAIILYFLKQAGAIVLYVGLLASYPIAMFIKFAAYKQIVGLGNKEAEASGL